MKKEYINPEMEVVRLTMNQHLLEGSDPDVVVNTGGSVDAGSVGASEWFDNGGSEDW